MTTFLRKRTQISRVFEIKTTRMKRTGKVDVARAKSDEIVGGSDRVGGDVSCGGKESVKVAFLYLRE